jgi:hypothetical protein
MKINISPSEDQSDQKYPYHSITVETGHDDDFTADRAAQMFYHAMVAFGFHGEHVKKAMNDFEL